MGGRKGSGEKAPVFSDYIYRPYLVHSPCKIQSMASVFLLTLAARFLVTPCEQGRLSTKRNPEKEPGRYLARMNQFDQSQTGRKAGCTAANFRVKT